ncbi:restriction endonuclease subunit S [Streptococcus alactolyticus]|uniref:restriction endonuclease subunit S n=1 Tax=Streptococcus alactolyticus TaxID=29389 RepID=UPI003CFEC2E9
MKTNSKPNIRFKGYTDDWEERKLGEIFNYEQPTKYIVKSTEYDDNFNTPVLTAGKSFLLGYTDEISGIKNATVENPVVIFDDFTTDSHYVDFPFKIKSSAMKLLSLNDNSDNFYFMFNTLKNIKYVPQSHERHWISKFSSFVIYKPSQEEQQKIGSFFKQLDDTIALHQRKCDQTKELKKFMLQKMFPKKGEKNPEIRFPGFTDDWEQRKLIDYLEVSKEKNKNEVFGKEDVLSVSGDYGIVNQIEFQGRSFAGASVAPYGIVDTGDIVYTKSPLKSNPYGIIKANKGKTGIVSTLYAVYKPLDNVCSDFVQIYFEQDARMNNYMRPLVNKGAKNDMKVSDVNALKGEVCFPSKYEQIKISEHFAKLDRLIALHQRKCEQLKELKKFMLQNMFPKKG